MNFEMDLLNQKVSFKQMLVIVISLSLSHLVLPVMGRLLLLLSLWCLYRQTDTLTDSFLSESEEHKDAENHSNLKCLLKLRCLDDKSVLEVYYIFLLVYLQAYQADKNYNYYKTWINVHLKGFFF